MGLNANRSSGGFTLVELLVVVALFGLVMGAMYSVYLNTQSSAYGEEEVVDLQQSLRVAMDWIGRDVGLAGFMLPDDDDAISNAPAVPTTTDRFTLQTASASGRIGRIVKRHSATLPAVPDDISSGEVQFEVASAAMVDLFKTDSGDPDYVRIIRPADNNQPVGRAFTVAGRTRGATPPTASSYPTITLAGFLASDEANFVSGDLIVLTADGAPHPNVVEYFLEGDELKREANSNGEAVVAQNITAFTLEYLAENGSAATDPEDISAVRVTLTGQTETGGRTRSLSNFFCLRNR